MDRDGWSRGNITRFALLVEGGLAVLSLVIGWLVGFSPLGGLETIVSDWPQHARAGGWGVVATLPMLLVVLAVDRFPVGPFEALKRIVDELIVPLFRGVSTIQIALICAAAGIGEELLFRGLLQGGLARWIGGPAGLWIAIAVASLVFGAMHFITPGYAALATLVGVYFGWLLVITGSLLAPIVAHSLYDFVALLYLVKRSGGGFEPSLCDGEQPPYEG